jgi:hypothetical protein
LLKFRVTLFLPQITQVLQTKTAAEKLLITPLNTAPLDGNNKHISLGRAKEELAQEQYAHMLKCSSRC